MVCLWYVEQEEEEGTEAATSAAAAPSRDGQEAASEGTERKMTNFSKKGDADLKTMEQVIADLQEHAGLRPELGNWLLHEYKVGDEYMMAAYDIYVVSKHLGQERHADSLFLIGPLLCIHAGR